VGGDGAKDTLNVNVAYAATNDVDTNLDGVEIININTGTTTAYTASTDAPIASGVEIDLSNQTEGFQINIVAAPSTAANEFTVKGSAGDDIIVGSAGSEVIYGGNGNDNISGAGGTDTITGDAGDDVFNVALGAASTAIVRIEDFGNGADSFKGVLSSTGQLDVTIYNTSTTTLDLSKVLGASGKASVTGGSAADTIIGGAAVDTINGGTGNDDIKAGAGNDTINGEGGDDTLTGGLGVDEFTVDAGTDTITDWGTGSDTLILSAGTASYTVPTAGGTVATFANATNTGTALIIDASSSKAVTIVGSTGVDSITGSEYADTITTSGGADSVYGGSGADGITVASQAALAAIATIVGGDGSDTLTINPASGAALTLINTNFANVSGVETLTIGANATSGTITIAANGITAGFTKIDASASAVTAIDLTSNTTAVTVLTGTANSTVTLANAATSVTGGATDETVVVGGLTATGTYALSTGTDVITTTDGASLVGVNSGAATTAETLNFADDVAMTAAQLNGFTSLVGTGTPVITLTTAITAAMLDDAVIDSTNDISIKLADVANNAITAVAATLGTSGDILTIDGSDLTGTNALTFIGTNETTGIFHVSGGAATDNITAGSGGDIITGNGGDDQITAAGGTSVTTIVFGASAALNGADTISGFEAGTSASDGEILDFRAFVTGRLVDAGGSANTGSSAVTEFSRAATGEESIADKVVVFDNGGSALTATTLAAEFANGTAAAGTTAAFADLNTSFKAVVIEGNSASAATGKIWYVNSALDGTATDVTATDIVLVGTLSTNIDIDAITGNQIL
jgi:Ca2+-binding RTX toxin-like protein